MKVRNILRENARDYVASTDVDATIEEMGFNSEFSNEENDENLININTERNLFLSYFTWWQQKYINNLQVNISSRLYSKFLYQPYSFFLDKNSAELVRNVNNEVARLSRAIMYFVTLLTESLVLIFLTLLILLVDPLNGMLISSILILSFTVSPYLKY